ncbi:hypothetical protein M9435_006332 [Picochlorum sp. BPE23]|nr:hypothetical protein M9435_006332 [Picochlorum sp. BPE23]
MILETNLSTGKESVSIPELHSVGKRIFDDIAKERKVSDLHLASLKLLFDKHALKATSIVDSGGVSCFVGQKTGRKVYQVKGHKSGDTYTVFPDHYCSCHSFFYDIATKSEGIYCKHQVAVYLSNALEKTRIQTVQDLVIAEILQDITHSSDFTNHHQKEFSNGDTLELSASNHRNDGKIVSEGGASLMGHTGVVHEHDVGLEEHSSPAKALLLLLLGLHLIGVLIWLRFWLKDRKIKFPRMKNTPPPQKQSCTYDIDSRYISKIELPLKALKIAK